MKQLYDSISSESSKIITKKYSTSFSIAVNLLSSNIREAIYNIYGFVRVADEIVDSFEEYPKEELLDRFEEEYRYSLKVGISTNPVINAFQGTVSKYNIDHALVDSFLKSMRTDLEKQNYDNQEEIDNYIYGSADVVGLMCLKVFVQGDDEKYNNLKEPAMKLGSAFQKVNFLRDLNEDFENLNRSYFPNINPNNFTEADKSKVLLEINNDFEEAYKGIVKLPKEAKLAVYVAYKYYFNLLHKIERTPSNTLKEKRIRVSNPKKMALLVVSFFNFKLNLV
ncbi:phytoene/squalene synthase family protein [Flavobacteriaceae bacterium]|jgi:15-cis-phytoene synthase|nr:phytoene/squalene synthase family protein [Flavobacteriaceae bacterium]MDA9907156.1 phytoene/squalene synthase family protein [Flavobacteriaceae bacterium]